MPIALKVLLPLSTQYRAARIAYVVRKCALSQINNILPLEVFRLCRSRQSTVLKSYVIFPLLWYMTQPLSDTLPLSGSSHG